VLSGLRRVVAAGDASTDRAGQAVADLLDLPIERYPHAAYVALAESITADGATLLTADGRLARAMGAHADVRVTLAE
jgi:hypothetical protein